MKPHVQPKTRRGIGPKKGDYTRCSACIIGGIIVDPESNVPDHRPQFICTRCGSRFTHGKSGEPHFSALRGFALPPGWGICKDIYVREDSALVIPRGGLWWHSAESKGYETPLAAMQAADAITHSS